MVSTRNSHPFAADVRDTSAMTDWDQGEQAYDDSSTGEPVVGGWGDTYGEAVRQTDIPDVLATLMMVGNDSESLY
jgi:hypothetical protein